MSSRICCRICNTPMVKVDKDLLECPACGFGQLIHDFATQLNISMETAGTEWVENAYWDSFGNLGLIKVETITDIELQRKGYDKICHFTNGKKVIFDEKHRPKDYGDILIEIWSNMERRRPGWLENNADYIASFFEPTKRVVWLPLLLLNKWLKTRTEIIPWMKTPENESLLPCPPWNRVVYAVNEGYTTASIAGPNGFILSGIQQAMAEHIKTSQQLKAKIPKQLNYLDLLDLDLRPDHAADCTCGRCFVWKVKHIW